MRRISLYRVDDETSRNPDLIDVVWLERIPNRQILPLLALVPPVRPIHSLQGQVRVYKLRQRVHHRCVGLAGLEPNDAREILDEIVEGWAGQQGLQDGVNKTPV